jgi:PmbA protein
VCVPELLDLARSLLERARSAGATDAAAGVSTERSVSYVWRAGRLETTSEATSRGASLSVFADGRWSVHHTSDLRPTSLDGFARDAVALTRALAPDPDRVLPDPARYADPAAAPALDVADPDIGGITREERVAWLAAMEDAAGGDDRVLSVTADVYDASARSALATTNGFAGEWGDTSAWNSVSVTCRDADDRRPEESWGTGGHFRSDLRDPAEVGRIAKERALSRLGARRGPSGNQTMVVDPRAGGNLVNRLLGSANARAVQQQQSFWAGQIGKKLFSPKLTLTDDPLVPRGLASRPWDGEGLRSHPLPLIEAGVATGLYVDTYYGRKAGLTPTTGGPSNRRFALGDRDRAAWLREVGTGILVTSWLGGNADQTTGDFSLGLRGFAIVNGEIGAPVAEMNVTGNLVGLFAALAGVGNDPWAYGAIASPTLVFENVSFAGA